MNHTIPIFESSHFRSVTFLHIRPVLGHFFPVCLRAIHM